MCKKRNQTTFIKSRNHATYLTSHLKSQKQGVLPLLPFACVTDEVCTVTYVINVVEHAMGKKATRQSSLSVVGSTSNRRRPAVFLAQSPDHHARLIFSSSRCYAAFEMEIVRSICSSCEDGVLWYVRQGTIGERHERQGPSLADWFQRHGAT